MSQDSTSSKHFWLFSFLAFLLYGVLLALVYSVVRSDIRRELLDESLTELATAIDSFDQALEEAQTKVLFLSQTPPIQGIVRASEAGGVDPHDSTPLAEWKRRLQSIFVSFIAANPEIRQARYIGVNDGGLELVRVHKTRQQVQIAAQTELQTKGTRAYFREISSLKPGQRYTSQLELNREFGQLESPHWPTFRTARPIFTQSEQFFGAIILNVDASDTLSKIKSITSNELYLIDPQGQFYVHPDANRVFAKDKRLDYLWQTEFSQAPPLHYQNQFGFIYDEQGLGYYALSKSYLVDSNAPNQQVFHFIKLIPNTRVLALIRPHFFTQGAVLTLVFGVGFLIAFLYHRSLVSKQAQLDAQQHAGALINGSMDAIIIFNGDHEVIEWNASAEHMFGYPPQEFKELSLVKLLDTENPQGLNTLERANNEAIAVELEGRRRSNERFTASITLSPFSKTRIKPSGFAMIARDISGHKLLEAKLRATNELLEQKVRVRTLEMQEARDQALAANESKSRFLANMSHEIRTPMNGIFGMLNLLRRDTLSERQQNYLAMAEESVRALTNLINDILDFSKVEAGKLELHEDTFDLIKGMHSVVSSFSVQARTKSINLILDLHEIGHTWVIGDENRLRQIISNLLGNALKFTESGDIVVRAKTEKRSEHILLECRVIDTGLGISEAAQAKLFKAFVQESSATSAQFGGTGLGLSICKQLCRLMKGDISVLSEPGRGSEFIFSLQFKIAPQEDEAPYDLDLNGLAVLVLEPDAKLGANAAAIFRRWGAKVNTATNAEAYFAAYYDDDSPCPALVLFNAELYSEHAAALCSLSSAAPHEPEVKLVMVTSHQTPENTRTQAAARGCLIMDAPISPYNLSYLLLSQLAKPTGAYTTYSSFQARSDLRLDGVRILVVDDHMINQQVASGLLQELGAEVALANNGQEALHILRTADAAARPALILMDCQMPLLDGYETTVAIRKGEAGSALTEIPIVAMTAGAMSGDNERCLAAGMNDYLPKPFEPSKLEQKLRLWLKLPDTPLPESSEEDGFSVIWDKKTALRRVNNNEKLFAKVLSMYLASTPEALEAIKSVLAADQQPELRAKAHSLKGISASVGAVTVASLCEQLEKSENVSHEYVNETYQQLITAYSAFTRCVEAQQ